jgi:AcrR family transcriptional regulator
MEQLTESIELRIMDVARELFFRHGLKSITMDDIAQQLGMSKKTIYQHYADKDALVMAMMRHLTYCHERDIQDVRKSSENAIHEILLAMNTFAAAFARINPTLFHDLQKYHPASWRMFKEFKDKQMIGFLEDNMRRGIRQELYRKDINIKVLSRLRLGEVDLGFNPQVFPSDQFPLPEVQMVLLEHFLYGIVSLRGYKMINRYKQINEE